MNAKIYGKSTTLVDGITMYCLQIENEIGRENICVAEDDFNQYNFT